MKSSNNYQLLGEQNEINETIVQSLSEKESCLGTTTVKKEFRDDVALLRALAILAVLGYHFWPKIFTLGFIGVDVFFVISGFLMMQMLEISSSNRPDRVFLSFYYRRLKRIVPLYYFIVFLIGFSMIFVYTIVWNQRYFRYYLPALFFYENLYLLKSEGDYFAEGTEDLPLLHSWSLGVEMQFYLIAPFLFYISKIETLKFGHILLFICFLCSLLFQFNTSSITSFYHPFSRIWQFLCGMGASLYTKKIEKASSSSKSNLIATIFLLNTFFIFLPFYKVTSLSFFQIFVTISSAGFILFGANCTIRWSHFHLGYIAQISYALYLVHYPVLRFSQYLAQYFEKENYVPISALFLTFLISILVHHFFEKPLLRAGKENFTVCIKYFALSLLIGFKWKMMLNPECDRSVISENEKFLDTLYPLEGGHFVDDGFMKAEPPFGHYVYEGNTGHLKIVILGNSWATQEAHLIRKMFPKEEVAEMHLFSQGAYTFGLHGNSPTVKELTPFLMDFLKKLQPDYIFLLVRYNQYCTNRDLEPFIGRNDSILKEYLEGIHNLSRFTKKLFIQTHQPFDCYGKEKKLLNHFLDALQKKTNLKKFNRPFNIPAFYNSSVYQRLRIVFEKCSNCYRIDVAEAFIDMKNHRLLAYDEETELLYFENRCHLTTSGLKMIEKPLRESIEKGIKSNGKHNW